MPRPARRRLPVAVVGIGQRRAADQHPGMSRAGGAALRFGGTCLRDIETADIHTPRMRRAGRDCCRWRLMDARNHTLRWIGVLETRAGRARLAACRCWPRSIRRCGSSVISAGSRSTGSPATCSATAARPAIRRRRGWPRSKPRPIAGTTPRRYRTTRAGGSTCRICRQRKQYLVDTIEITLDLLASAGPDDELALFLPPRAAARGHAWRGVGDHRADARHAAR